MPSDAQRASADVSWLRGRIRSVGFALRGVGELLRWQQNARIHALATAVVVGMGAWLDVSRGEWLALALAITAVWGAEAFNTALESLGDAVTLEHDPHVRDAKDIAAAAVLITAVGAAAVGLLVFAPALLERLG